MQNIFYKWVLSIVFLIGFVPVYACNNLDQSLFKAVQYGDVKACEKFLQAGADPKKSVKVELSEFELLPLAAAARYYDICKLLIQYGAKLEARGCGGYTALHFAAENGDYNLCNYLLEMGAQVNAKVPDDTGSCSNFTPLFFAVATGNVDLCKLLIQFKADINHQAIFWCWKNTPLDYAAQKGQFAICKLLVQKGAYIKYDFAYGTPEIRDYVQLAYDLKLAHAKMVPLKSFVEQYLSGELSQKKNVFNITRLALTFWGMESDFFKSLWASYTANLKNYFFLASDFESVKNGKMQPVDYGNKHLHKENITYNAPLVAELLINNRDSELTKKFMQVVASNFLVLAKKKIEQ